MDNSKKIKSKNKDKKAQLNIRLSQAEKKRLKRKAIRVGGYRKRVYVAA